MKRVRFPCGHELNVLDHRAAAHDFEKWEATYVRALCATLRPNDIVWDIGAENGEFAALAALTVGGNRVYLFEPSPTSWPGLRALWEANGLHHPAGCFPGFVADACRNEYLDWEWPEFSKSPVHEETCFATYYERPDLPSTTLACFARDAELCPDVLMIDVEGAEGLVLSTLGELYPLPRAVFVSIHSQDFIVRYGREQDQERVFRQMAVLGYNAKFLGFDHEAHWMWIR